MKLPAIFLLIALYCVHPLYAQESPSSGIRFTENKGQWEEAVAFKANVPSGSLFLQKQGLTWLFWDPTFFARHHGHQPSTTGIAAEMDEEEHLLNMHAFQIQFVGANQNCTLEGSEAASFKTNYFIGDDRSKWASNLQSYEKVHYKQVWTGIDLSVFQFGNTMKYEFELAAGIAADLVQMEYQGADSLYLEQGRLMVKTSVLSYAEDKPLAWQYKDNKQIIVPCEFKITNNKVSFVFPEGYDPDLPLTIDPKLIFSTYSGATSDNWGNSACFDEAGHLYSAGTTFMAGFPATTGAFQTSFLGRTSTITSTGYGIGIDCAILKFSPDGTQLLAATYLGGYESEMPFSLFVNYNNELLILGATSSNGAFGPKFPVSSGAYQTNFGGGTVLDPLGLGNGVRLLQGSDLFVAKLSGDLSNMLACTFVGGTANDGVQNFNHILVQNYGDQFRGDIITDSLNNVYVASNTTSANFFGTVVGGFDHVFNGGQEDGVVFKLNADLSQMLWGTYMGGIGEDAAFSLQLDSVNNVYATGGTSSSDFPIVTGAYDPSYNGNIDAWVAKIKGDGSGLVSSTFIGTTAYDQSYFVQVDSAAHVYLLGQTEGVFPVINANYSNAGGGIFVAELDSSLASLEMSTVLGSGGFRPNISPTAFLVNQCGNIFINGWGGSNNVTIHGSGGSTVGLPITSNAYQSVTDGSDFYLMVLQRQAQSLLYASYIGDLTVGASGDHVDGGTSRFDKKGIVYAAVCGGCGGSSGFPTFPDPGAWSNTNNSNFVISGMTMRNCNNAAYKFDLANLEAAFSSDHSGCNSGLVTFNNESIGGVSFEWYVDGVLFSTSSTTATYNFNNSGVYKVMLIALDATTCIGKDTVEQDIIVNLFYQSISIKPDTSICLGDTIQLWVTPNNPSYTYAWTPANNISSVTTATTNVWPTSSSTYYVTVTDDIGCVTTDSVKVTVGAVALPSTWWPQSNCSGEVSAVFTNESSGGFNFYWQFGDGSSSSGRKQTVVHTYPAAGSYQATLLMSNGGCEARDTLNIQLEAVKIPNLMTVNNDGKNDVFEIEGLTDNWTVEVYNRWGQAVFKKENYNNEFDAAGLNDGIYYWLVISPDGRECKGWVHVTK